MPDGEKMVPGRLRRRAEAILQGREPDLEGFTQEDLQDLVHEIQVHQVELELQNEALRETQQVLEMARDEYADLYDGAPVGYFSVDELGRIARVNATGAALLAAEAQALVGRPFHKLVAPESQEAFHFFLVGLSRGGRPETVELDLLRADGDRFRAQIQGLMPEFGQQGPRRWRAAVSDVTAEHEARQALQRYADEQSALHAVAAALATSLDPAEMAGRVLGVLLDVFDATAAWLAVASEPSAGPRPVLVSRAVEIDAEALGSYLATCPRCADILAGRADAGGDPAAAIRCRQEPADTLTQAGLQRLVCLPLVAHEHVLGVLTLAWEDEHGLIDSDETLLRTVGQQIALGLRNAQLYGQVHALLRQREATQALLVQNEKVAALGRLTASLSHEINNPLQSVLGCLALAEEGLDPAADDDPVGPYLAVAIKEIQRIAVLVRRMREFYAPRSENSILADVENVLSAVVDLTQVELAKRDVAIAWQPSGRPQRMIMRPDQLQQVFLNLLLNAAEAMPAGGTVTLRLDRDEMPRGEGGSAPAVRVDVQDGGEGMPSEVQRQLFEPFFTTKPEGSGLGLYICHRIIREHGGEIEVHSREGEGTTVSTWLPAPAPE